MFRIAAFIVRFRVPRLKQYSPAALSPTRPVSVVSIGKYTFRARSNNWRLFSSQDTNKYVLSVFRTKSNADSNSTAVLPCEVAAQNTVMSAGQNSIRSVALNVPPGTVCPNIQRVPNVSGCCLIASNSASKVSDNCASHSARVLVS